MPQTERVLIKRGNLTGTTGAQAAPGSAATITIFDSTVVDPMWDPIGVPFERLVLSVISSADSGANGVVHSSSLDRGTNFDTITTNTYLTANGQTTYDYLMRGGHVKIAYTNSAAVLTTWRYELWGVYDRNPGS